MVRKYTVKGLLPGITFDIEHPDDIQKRMKKFAKEAKKGKHDKPASMEDIRDLIFEVKEGEEFEPPKASITIPETHAEALYSIAYSLYESGQYKKAADMFRLLVMMNTFEYKYVFGLAASLQKAEEYFFSATAYMMAATLDTSCPLPHFHSSECYMKMNDPASACIALSLAIDASGKQEKYAVLKERCILAKNKLSKMVKKMIKEEKLKKLKKARKKEQAKRMKMQKEVKTHGD